jgi:hypothetical protein
MASKTVNPIYSLIELRQSHHYYHHFSTLMVLLVYGYLVYFIAASLTITFLYLLSCNAISHTRIVALVLFPRWCKRLVCVELYQWLIELERTFILPLAPRWVRHSYLLKRLHTIPYTCGISPSHEVSPRCRPGIRMETFGLSLKTPVRQGWVQRHRPPRS